MNPLEYAVVELDLIAPGHEERRTGFVRAVSRAFLDPRPSAEYAARYIDQYAADGVRAVGVWLPEDAFGAGPVPVATFISFDGTLNTGSELLPVSMITDVTVSPAHRRRGLLSRLMGADLERARAAGSPMAALTASEGGIYGRFGFAPATSVQTVHVDLGPGFALRTDVPGVRVELVVADDLGTIPEDDFAELHRRARGSISRPAYYEPWLRGQLDLATGEEDRRVHCAVALDADESPVGHVTWKAVGKKDGRHTIEVIDLVGRSPAAHLALWRFVAGIDLAEVAVAQMSRTDPLRWALVNPRSITVTREEDLLWLRILDVPRALAARPWRADGRVVVRTTDPRGLADGVWEIAVRDGRATIEEGGNPEVNIDIKALAALYLGGVDVTTLTAAGRVTGSADSIATLASMLGDARIPETRTFF